MLDKVFPIVIRQDRKQYIYKTIHKHTCLRALMYFSLLKLFWCNIIPEDLLVYVYGWGLVMHKCVNKLGHPGLD